MPPECNALDRIDKSKDFCKENCRWIKKPQGRRKKDNIPGVNKKNKKALTKPKNVCLRLEEAQLDFITRQALRRSIDEGTALGANDLIRQAIAEAFPYNKQKEMFK